MEVEINGQKKEIKEVKYLDAVEVEEVREKEGLRAAMKKFLIKSGLTEEEAENLPLNEGKKIQKVITDNAQDFQNPVVEESD